MRAPGIEPGRQSQCGNTSTLRATTTPRSRMPFADAILETWRCDHFVFLVLVLEDDSKAALTICDCWAKKLKYNRRVLT